MINIKIDMKKFKEISFEDALNYKHIPELEKSIADLMDYLELDMNTKKKNKLTQEQRMAYFLRKALLYITSDSACIKAIEACSTALDSDYIHTVLKKHYYKLEYDFDSLIGQ
jgi:hypothetical protein